ncbi:hypothetical protein [Roseivirga pacifica]|uniref:hypothetical protein n=1 Tax=Roseivirga pacifica TaxID=1267423 RepID=UPI00227B322D|nr:hypothetical protein [Roseivirga pacifica]
MNLKPQILKFLGHNEPYCFIKKAIGNQALPNTPVRGQLSMSELNLPKQLDLKIDKYLLEIVKILNEPIVNLQFNIDSYDLENWSKHLAFHYDRGARFTVLATLRGLSNKFTAIIPINNIIDHLPDKKVALELCKAQYGSELNLSKPNFPVMELHCGKYVLSSSIIDQGLEFKDLIGLNKKAQEALCTLLSTITLLDEAILDKEITQWPKEYSKFGAVGFNLLEGDILILNNKMILHGRTCGYVEIPHLNRWLRVIFLGRV